MAIVTNKNAFELFIISEDFICTVYDISELIILIILSLKRVHSQTMQELTQISTGVF